MNKIEKIKEWVKKQKKEELARNSIGVITGHTFFVDANELLSFLDTLSEEPDKSLEEAAEEFYDNTFDELGGFAETRNGSYDVFFPSNAIRDAFIAGAEWQKEQMLKDAVEGYVTQKINGERYAKAQVSDSMGLKFGDKVRIIVLKAEEESE